MDQQVARASGPDAPDAAHGSDPGRAVPVGTPVVDPAPETLRLYARDWAHFVAWCRQHAVLSLPASPDTLAHHLLSLAPDCSRGTLGRRRSAIAAMQREHDLPIPALDRKSWAVLRQTSRPRTAAKPAAKPASATLVRLVTSLPRDLAGLRDRAMLLLLAAAAANGGGVTRGALLDLDAEHLRLTPGGAELRLRTRADEGEPTLRLTLARSATPAACPVRALEDWLRASDTAYGPVWRKVTRWGSVEHARLGPDAWRRVLSRHLGKQPGRHG